MRRFFRFSIRDLLWLTLVVALCLAWGIREVQYRQLRNDVYELERIAKGAHMRSRFLEEELKELKQTVKTAAPSQATSNPSN